MPHQGTGTGPTMPCGPVRLENRHLVIVYDPQLGCLSLMRQGALGPFIPQARFDEPVIDVAVASCSHEALGEAQVLHARHPSGSTSQVTLFSQANFALITSRLGSVDDSDSSLDYLYPLRFSVDLHRDPRDLRLLGTGGLTRPGKRWGSYSFLAIADPETLRGVVCGWVTHQKGSGVLFAEASRGDVLVDCRLDYGRVSRKAAEGLETELLFVGHFDDARLGLEAYADTVRTIHSIELPKVPTGYCTWYSRPHGGACDQEHLPRLLSAAQELRPFGFGVVQIDDGWQEGRKRNGPAKNFTSHRSDGPYPQGMDTVARMIDKAGYTPGIWLMPFAGDHQDPVFADRQDLFVKRPDGSPFETPWGGTSLDMTNPKARQYVAGVIRQVTEKWGFRYLKLDGLWTGTATEQMYINDVYKDDGIGEAVFHDPKKTNIEAYRDGLRLVRNAAGKDVFLLGCNLAQNMRTLGGSFGLVDGMRIGPDNGTTWEHLKRGPLFGSRLYFLHGRVWYNDPDPVYIRPDIPLEQARLICSWVAVSGQMLMDSDWLPDVPAERVEILKRCLPNHGLLPRPVDLFERDIPRIWLLCKSSGETNRLVLGLFNWDEETATIEYSLEKMGLSRGETYLAFDYWQNSLADHIKGRLSVSVPGRSCRILSLRPMARHPQLISTSRHVTQGIVDVLDEKWNEEMRTLTGTSKLVANDPYELRIATSPSDGWVVKEAQASALGRGQLRTSIEQEAGLVRVSFIATENCQVKWSVRFAGVS